MKIPEALEKILQGADLAQEEARSLMGEILAGRMTPVQSASLLVALRAKGESAAEIAGCVEAMRGAMVRIESRHSVVVDTCGTGGDGTSTFNISTAAALVAAGAGAAVAKHGNRSVSSKSGSADVFEALGVKIDMPQRVAQRCLNDIGITFLFAPLYHPAMKNVAPVRKELGVRTLFNLIGPLSNPAGANAQVLGVPKKEFMPLIGDALKRLSSKKSGTVLIVNEAGHDEMILAGACSVREISNGKVKSYALVPGKLKLPKVAPGALRGGSALENAQILKRVLNNEDLPVRQVVIANAALALFAADSAAGKLQRSLAECAARSRRSLESGAALEKLEDLIRESRRGE